MDDHPGPLIVMSSFRASGEKKTIGNQPIYCWSNGHLKGIRSDTVDADHQYSSRLLLRHDGGQKHNETRKEQRQMGKELHPNKIRLVLLQA